MKKVLIVTYYWPPAGGISLHRCLKFAKYLSQFGWEPVVYTAKNAQYPYFDDSNFKDIPEGITVLKRPILEPFEIFKKISGRKKSDSLNNVLHVRDRKSSIIDKIAIWIRGNFFIPDARSLWIRPSVKFLINYLKQNPVDAILSDGPPHTNTVIACQVSEKLSIPFLADFQDPWTQVDYYQLFGISHFAHSIHQKLEQRVFRQASKITIASYAWKKDLESIGARNVDVIYWGYDEDDFKDIQVNLDTQFSIFHGGLLGFDRSPDGLIKVLGRLSRDNESFKKNLVLKLAGQIDYSVIEKINEEGLASNLVLLGTISRREVLQHTVNARILLLLLNRTKNAEGRVPGKFFEYLRAKRPILCFGPGTGDVANIVQTTNSGIVLDYENEEKTKEYIFNAYNNFLNRKDQLEQRNIEMYNVKIQTGHVANYLNQITVEEK